MTEPSEFAQAEDALPGLEPPTRAETQLVTATRRTIKALEAAGYLDETHAMPCRLMLKLAAAVDSGVAQGKASAVAMAAAQLLATYQELRPETEGGDAGDAWNELVADMRRSATTPRDST